MSIGKELTDKFITISNKMFADGIRELTLHYNAVMEDTLIGQFNADKYTVEIDKIFNKIIAVQDNCVEDVEFTMDIDWLIFDIANKKEFCRIMDNNYHIYIAWRTSDILVDFSCMNLQ
jgi:hypothetical protein